MAKRAVLLAASLLWRSYYLSIAATRPSSLGTRSSGERGIDVRRQFIPRSRPPSGNSRSDPSASSGAAAMSAEQRQMEATLKAYLINYRKNEIAAMTAFAERGEAAKKNTHGQPEVPPLQIADYPDLLERAWGWDRLLPYFPVNPWSQYKKYLQQYYRLNTLAPPTELVHQMESTAAGDGSLNGGDENDIAALVESCINMEGELKNLLKRRPQIFHDDEISRSNKIINCVRKMTNVTCCEFPAAVIAFKCIAKETDLMCELAMSGIHSTSLMRISSDIRQHALRFMRYKGGEYLAAAAATMMGATREAKVMCVVLRKERDNKKGDFSMSEFLRGRTMGAMNKIYRECPDIEEPTRGPEVQKRWLEETGSPLAGPT